MRTDRVAAGELYKPPAWEGVVRGTRHVSGRGGGDCLTDVHFVLNFNLFEHISFVITVYINMTFIYYYRDSCRKKNCPLLLFTHIMYAETSV